MPGLAIGERLEQLADLRAWALAHTLWVRIDDNEEAPFTLKDCLWMSHMPHRDSSGSPSHASDPPSHACQDKGSGDYVISAYVKEAVIDRDRHWLRELDPSLQPHMTVAAGRLHWRSKWRQERALYVTVPGSVFDKDTHSKNSDKNKWWHKAAGESGMHTTSPFLLRFLVENVW